MQQVLISCVDAFIHVRKPFFSSNSAAPASDTTASTMWCLCSMCSCKAAPSSTRPFSYLSFSWRTEAGGHQLCKLCRQQGYWNHPIPCWLFVQDSFHAAHRLIFLLPGTLYKVVRGKSRPMLYGTHEIPSWYYFPDRTNEIHSWY